MIMTCFFKDNPGCPACMDDIKEIAFEGMGRHYGETMRIRTSDNSVVRLPTGAIKSMYPQKACDVQVALGGFVETQNKEYPDCPCLVLDTGINDLKRVTAIYFYDNKHVCIEVEADNTAPDNYVIPIDVQSVIQITFYQDNL